MLLKSSNAVQLCPPKWVPTLWLLSFPFPSLKTKCVKALRLTEMLTVCFFLNFLGSICATTTSGHRAASILQNKIKRLHFCHWCLYATCLWTYAAVVIFTSVKPGLYQQSGVTWELPMKFSLHQLWPPGSLFTSELDPSAVSLPAARPAAGCCSEPRTGTQRSTSARGCGWLRGSPPAGAAAAPEE